MNHVFCLSTERTICKMLRNEKMMKIKFMLVIVLIFIAAAGLLDSLIAQETTVDAPRPHTVGQSVSPSYEGWYPNADGSFSMVFGYFNRNHEEYLDIPVGPANHVKPGAPDRGQPTHFLPRRNTGVFAVVVPEDFGQQELWWSLTVNGETIEIPGHLRPEWQIDALQDVANSNTPPVLRFREDGDFGQGPGGIEVQKTSSLSQSMTISVWAQDDGVSRARSRRGGPMVTWSKYRGPGTVTFGETQPANAPTGLAVTEVSFGAPGQYILRALASDESGGQRAVMAGGFYCCWTNGYVRVDVN